MSKKNIVVVTSAVPFYYGGNEILAEYLARALNRAGYNACHFFTPRNSYDSFKDLLGGYIANRFTDLKTYPWKNRIDQIISLTYPAYAIKHETHVCWLTHRMKEYYNLWPRWLENEGESTGRVKLHIQRKILHGIDNYYLNKVTRLYSESRTIQQRLQEWGGFETEVVYPPPEDDTNYEGGTYAPYIFTVSRLTSMKRIHLLLSAMKHVKTGKVMIAGAGEERENLEAYAEKLGFSHRVRFLGRITEEEKNELMLGCRAFFFAPYEEDYGIVTLEAMKRGKAVITAVDSGGPTEFVEDGVNGFVKKPEESEMGEAISRLLENEPLAREMGRNALKTVEEITWENTIRKLVIV